ncbi:hypothetical protein AS034_15355 [[Bacillus] enclensis]|uniref:Uncharacterized protein n=1 Tax=[Bacillus] enclensis TaxID=1402860 RepID=A0A0V8HEW8_9BACI|nr:hypothetical protein AS034_15355 [[Bacillus] enclensis]SCC21886.1 hypothetical protein GA0061094_3175 [[Bacillus] enclensis]
MKKRPYLLTLKIKWHSLRITYLNALLECCLDLKLKQKLQGSIHYHEMKLLKHIHQPPKSYTQM